HALGSRVARKLTQHGNSKGARSGAGIAGSSLMQTELRPLPSGMAGTAKGGETSGPGSDRYLGLGIEEVQSRRVDGETDLILHLGAGGGIDGGYHGVAADAHVEQDLRAKLLHHLDLGGEGEAGRIGLGGDVQVLRPDADRHLAADMAAQAL